jgi:AcrR family transcriptional regulator
VSSKNSSETEARQRILAAAVEVIDSDGEAALRITDIAERAGVAPGLINHHFGSRDGLVVAAQVARYDTVLDSELEMFRGLFGEVTSRDELMESLRLGFAIIANRERAAERFTRVTVLGSVQGRPELRAAMSESIATAIDRAATVIELGQSEGILRVDVDSRAAATVLQALGFGSVLADLDARPVAHEPFVDVVAVFIGSLFAPES